MCKQARNQLLTSPSGFSWYISNTTVGLCPQEGGGGGVLIDLLKPSWAVNNYKHTFRLSLPNKRRNTSIIVHVKYFPVGHILLAKLLGTKLGKLVTYSRISLRQTDTLRSTVVCLLLGGVRTSVASGIFQVGIAIHTWATGLYVFRASSGCKARTLVRKAIAIMGVSLCKPRTKWKIWAHWLTDWLTDQLSNQRIEWLINQPCLSQSCVYLT